jgi:hypothetical protein
MTAACSATATLRALSRRSRLSGMSWLREYWRLLNRGKQINGGVAWVILVTVAFVLVVMMASRG